MLRTAGSSIQRSRELWPENWPIELTGEIRKAPQSFRAIGCENDAAPVKGSDSSSRSFYRISVSGIVFNVEQIEGLPEHYHGKPEVRTDSVQRIAHAEDFFAATGANVVHGGSRACYIPSTHNIHMPCIDFFRDAESYYAVRAHETTHYAVTRFMPHG